MGVVNINNSKKQDAQQSLPCIETLAITTQQELLQG